MNKYAVIMAGGGGTRFWPLSRKKNPKQLLNLTGNDYMINETIERLKYSVDSKHIFIVTNEQQYNRMIEVVDGKIPVENILVETDARNTSACIGYAAVDILKKHGDGVMIVTPSDAYIKDTATFTRVLSKAVEVVQEKDKLLTIGIKPTFAAIGYGYIKFEDGNNDVEIVLEFKEKPDKLTAEEYLSNGNYFWNSGMFIWKVSTILKKYNEFVPDIYKDLIEIYDAIGTENEKNILREVYSNIRKISVDYAIMEPASLKNDIMVIKGDFGWSDVGSWDMLGKLHDSNENNNILVGNVVTVNTENTIAYSSKRLVATIGIKDMIVVETEDAILVSSLDEAQNVGKIVNCLNELGMNEVL